MVTRTGMAFAPQACPEEAGSCPLLHPVDPMPLEQAVCTHLTYQVLSLHRGPLPAEVACRLGLRPPEAARGVPCGCFPRVPIQTEKGKGKQGSEL